MKKRLSKYNPRGIFKISTEFFKPGVSLKKRSNLIKQIKTFYPDDLFENFLTVNHYILDDLIQNRNNCIQDLIIIILRYMYEEIKKRYIMLKNSKMNIDNFLNKYNFEPSFKKKRKALFKVRPSIIKELDYLTIYLHNIRYDLINRSNIPRLVKPY
jgi:hypothetical protein